MITRGFPSQMNIRKIFFLLFCIPTIVGCAYNIRSSAIEEHYRTFIGQSYNPRITMGGWRLINEDFDSLEVENYSLGPKCTWSLTVDKKTNIYVAFRFTSDRESCDKISMHP
jgi:hypothetical protein